MTLLHSRDGYTIEHRPGYTKITGPGSPPDAGLLAFTLSDLSSADRVAWLSDLVLNLMDHREQSDEENLYIALHAAIEAYSCKPQGGRP